MFVGNSKFSCNYAGSKESAAYHEAGHVIFYYLLMDQTYKYVKIEKNGNQWVGECCRDEESDSVNPDILSDDLKISFFSNYASITIAGFLSEKCYIDVNKIPFSTGSLFIPKYFGLIDDNNAFNDAIRRLIILKNNNVFTQELFEVEKGKILKKVEECIIYYWKEIEILAIKIIDNEYIEKKDLEIFLDGLCITK